MTVYLDVKELIQINLEMVQAWGGLAGVRDLNALEAAAMRPQSGYYSDTIEEAAALCESVLQNHPFLDGNKRTAITAVGVFFRMNGYALEFADRELYDWLMNLYETGKVNKHSLEIWFRAHVSEIA